MCTGVLLIKQYLTIFHHVFTVGSRVKWFFSSIKIKIQTFIWYWQGGVGIKNKMYRLYFRHNINLISSSSHAMEMYVVVRCRLQQHVDQKYYTEIAGIVLSKHTVMIVWTQLIFKFRIYFYSHKLIGGSVTPKSGPGFISFRVSVGGGGGVVTDPRTIKPTYCSVRVKIWKI